MALKDYYIILGVSPTEDASGIREAFRELAKRYHPDRGGPQATPRFQDIVEAYQVLSDPERRQRYSQALRRAQGRLATPFPPSSGGHAPPPEPLMPEPLSVPRGFHTISPSLEELAARWLRNFTGRGVPKGERVEGLTVEVLLSPTEAARGGVVSLGVPVFSPCPVCAGSGRDWLFPCTYCQEQGMIEAEERVRIPIPPRVRDGTTVEVPIRGLGIHNFYLRLSLRIAA
jgi:molecular chaperone DnaJ